MICVSGTQLKMTINYSDGQITNLLLMDWDEVWNKLKSMGLDSYPIYSKLMKHGYIDDYRLLGTDQFYDKGSFVQSIAVEEFESGNQDEEISAIVKKEESTNSEMRIYEKYPHLIEISMKGNNFHYFAIRPGEATENLTEEEKRILEQQSIRLNSI